ncbi:unnamed protein product [Gordionus sp. m RMFG-2023]
MHSTESENENKFGRRAAWSPNSRYGRSGERDWSNLVPNDETSFNPFFKQKYANQIICLVNGQIIDVGSTTEK